MLYWHELINQSRNGIVPLCLFGCNHNKSSFPPASELHAIYFITSTSSMNQGTGWTLQFLNFCGVH